MIKVWSYTEEYKSLRKKILKSIDRTLKSGQIFFGKELQKFEKQFIKKNNLKYGVAVGSGTDALYIALLGLGIKQNDEIITVSNTAIPTISAIKTCGAKVRFVDVGSDYLIKTDNIEKCISKKTKAIIPVHLYGQACDMEKICKIAKKHKLKIIEDCAQAQGAKFKNKYVGSFGDVGCFSFYPTKILGAYGNGGFISTNSVSLYKKVKRIRYYGIEQNNKKNRFNNKYYANEHGTNSRISEIQLSILNLKLSQVELWIKQRRKLAKIYSRGLKDTSLELPIENVKCKHVFHLYVVYHTKRDEIVKKLKENNIQTNINYPFPIHKMKAYKNKILNKFNYLPMTEKMAKGIFSLPLYPKLKENKVLKIIKILRKILRSI
jgi:aminotransferase EvaB|tara:strand:- start:46 stop:1176 length:1131 start_codon:yes stop_codon:yes gene_type:complete